ncbi:SDR family oxidoreductase [Planctomycetota bacterium]|nr:SDR family oxidoreductase [Planctomycetota bacterium]
MRLDGRIAIVTGASSGIGRGIAIELARDGANVAVVDLEERPKQGKHYDTDIQSTTVEEIEKLGCESMFYKVDISDEDAVKDMYKQISRDFGCIDIVVNNAGILVPKNMDDISVDEFEKVVSVNLTGTFMVTKYALPYVKKSKFGRIIHISSQQAFGGGGGPSYTATKAALVNMTKDTAVEVASNNVTVNVICPGYIETPLQDYHTQETIAEAKRRTPLPRFGTPKDIGRSAVFLASDDAEWITGTTLIVDGGWLAPV